MVNGHFYIGSTCTSLAKRFSNHKSDSVRHHNQKVYKYFNDTGWENVKIVLISEHYLDNKEQLLREEDSVIQSYIHDDKCLNCNRSFVGLDFIDYHKQYRVINKNRILEYNKQYYGNNKTTILEHNKQTYTCQCGSTLRISYKAHHERAKKHQTWLNDNKSESMDMVCDMAK